MGAPGQPKTGGRKRGTPNQEANGLEARCLQAGLDFFAELIRIAKDPQHPNHFAAIKEGCGYLYSKRKAVELSAPEDRDIRVIIEDYCTNKENF